jgi:hypothetical protein
VSTANAFARSIRNADVAAFRPTGSFEAVIRSADGRARVYARYVGDPATKETSRG